MKNNINILSSIAILLFALVFTGCQDWLDQEPQAQVSESTYFKTAEHFLNASNRCYSRIGWNSGDASSDLSNNQDDGYGRGITSADAEDTYWGDEYANIRNINIIIEKAEEYEGEQSDIESSVGVAYFFRAWHHFNLLKTYGGVPVVARVLDLDSEELFGARNSRYEVIFQIINDLDQAIAMLPAYVTYADAGGRVSLEAAQAFKARVLLYEATWEKYVGDKTDDGAGSTKPSGYPSIDEMLADAKAAAKSVMDDGPFELWDKRAELAAVDPSYADRHLYYLYTLEEGSNPAGLTKGDNKEFIFERVYDFNLGKTIGKNLSHAKPFGPSRKLVDMYPCTDGAPIQHSPLFQGYQNMMDEFQNRDLRLVSLVNLPFEKYWGYGAGAVGGGADYTLGFDGVEEESGYDFTYVPQILTESVRNNGYQGLKFVTEHAGRETKSESMNYPHIRLAEVYLIYAEASCELDGMISNADLDLTINKIRARAGVAALTNEMVNSWTDCNMLGEIRRERALELFGENFRFDDLKRWYLAHTVEMNHNICTVYTDGTEYSTATDPREEDDPLIYDPTAFSYGETQSEFAVSTYSGFVTTKAGALIFDGVGNRNFQERHYLEAIPIAQMQLNENLVQNPGW